MTYYIRTTHNFNNETRDWEFRKELPNVSPPSKLSLGVHGLERDSWTSLDDVVKFAISYHKGYTDESLPYDVNSKEFEKQVRDDVIKNLAELVELGLAKERDYEFDPFK